MDTYLIDVTHKMAMELFQFALYTTNTDQNKQPHGEGNTP